MGKTLKSYAQHRLEENMREYSFYYKKFKRLIMSMFKWENLPDGISARFIEDKLFDIGQLIFYKSAGGFYVVRQATFINLNDYEEPTEYHTISITGDNETISANDCIPIWNDHFREGNSKNVHFFAKELGNIKKTIDCNLEQLKNPTIISCTEGQRASVEAMLSKKTNGVPYIVTSKEWQELNANNINVFDMHVQDHTKNLFDIKQRVENEAMTFFGINNIDIAKRERLTQAEGEGNNEQISINFESMFQSRLNAVKQINKKFNLDIKVDIVDSLKNSRQMKEGLDNV